MKKKLFAYIFTLVLSLTAISGVLAKTGEKSKTAYLAIIIDDFGYNGEGTEEMLALEMPFTAAIMPFSEFTAENCQSIKDLDKEAIIHLPMESKDGKKSWVGTKGVFCDMTKEEIKSVVEDAFTAVDIAVGLNNHMGSAVMEDYERLEAVMDVVAENDVVFIDSLTTGASKGKEIAEKKSVDYLERTMFIDCQGNAAATEKNIIKAAEKAKENGWAVAIGHVGPAGGKTTAEALAKAQTEVEKMGVKFVFISELNELVNGIGDK